MFSSPRDAILTVGLGCLAITFMIILFSLTRTPYEIIEGIVNWVKSTKRRKDKKTTEGRHHIVEDADGPDGKDDSQVADHPSDDRAHQDGEKEAA